MKIIFLVAVLLRLSSFGELSAKPDPRVAELHKLHEYVVAKGKHVAGQIPASAPTSVQVSQQDFTKLMKQSVANLQALDQIDHLMAPKADQLAALEKIITDEGHTLGTANNVLARTSNMLQELRDKASLKALMGGK